MPGTLICPCPANAALTAIPHELCVSRIGQVQKALFQRVYSTGSTANKFTISSADPDLLASWTPLIAAADGTKVICSPILANPAHEVPDVRTFGGGNATPGGVTKIAGYNPSTFTAELHEVRPNVVTAMRDMTCEKQLGVYLVDENGRIWGVTDNLASPTIFKPIPIYSFYVLDRKLGGYEALDMHKIGWTFPAGWSDMLLAIVPTNFNPLDDLIPA